MATVESLIHELLPTLRAERGLSRSQLSRQTVREGYVGVPEGTIKAIEINPGRLPEADILEALAGALRIQPDAFYEYPIAVARRDAKGVRQAQRDAGERVAETMRAAAQQRHEHPGQQPEADPGRDVGGGQP